MALFTGTHEEYYDGSDHGNYQFISLDHLINNFIIAYVGEDKIIPKVKRTDIAFHMQRALQELSYDTLRSEKAQEWEVGPNLTIILPHDYVNYVKLSWNDSKGIERLIHPVRKTSNPRALLQESDYTPLEDISGNLQYASQSDTLTAYEGNSGSSQDDNVGSTYSAHAGGRYGMDPQYSQSNGTFYIDPVSGLIHFSGDMNGRTVTIKYISDSLATDGEMQVHKFAEEAMYKMAASAILSTRANIQEYIVHRFKKDAFAAKRTAKLRLSNLKIEELNQVMKGKSKQIKH